MGRAPLDIIAENMPTYADCYIEPKQVNVPSRIRVAKDAARIMAALAAEGFQITRIDADPGSYARMFPEKAKEIVDRQQYPDAKPQ